MTSRERVIAAVNHKTPDKCPADFGGTGVTGISADLMYQLRKTFGLSEHPIKVFDTYQFLGYVDEDLRESLNTDVIGVVPKTNLFGIKNNNWKDWTTNLKTPVLVPGEFNTIMNSKGELLAYPCGDKNCEPSGKMPEGGLYFDTLNHEFDMDDEDLDPKDNMEDYSLLDDETLSYMQKQITNLYENTDKYIVCNPGGLALGDIARINGPALKHPNGIRDVEEWYMSHLLRPEYIKEVFDFQSEIGVKNLKLFHEAVGDKVQAVFLSGTDFGGQNGPLYSVETIRDLYVPYWKKMTDWIHKNTNWKVFLHSCGSVEAFIDTFIDAGVDILNPVQCSAANMDPKHLKETYGDRITFWGGGIDTQKTLPFGTVDEVEREVSERLKIFNNNGGYVFSTIHNSQAKVPPENFVKMIETFVLNR